MWLKGKYPNQPFTAFIAKGPANQFSHATKIERQSQDALDLQRCLQDATDQYDDYYMRNYD
jgi:hypothetical protein